MIIAHNNKQRDGWTVPDIASVWGCNRGRRGLITVKSGLNMPGSPDLYKI